MTIKEYAVEIPSLIHEAKALWGEEPTPYLQLGKYGQRAIVYPPRWAYHFEMMQRSNDPVEYLEKNTPHKNLKDN